MSDNLGTVLYRLQEVEKRERELSKRVEAHEKAISQAGFTMRALLWLSGAIVTVATQWDLIKKVIGGLLK